LEPDHPKVEVNMNNLGRLYAAMDNFVKAHYFFKKAQKIEDNLIDQIMGFTSEDRMLKFLITRKTNLYLFLSLVSQHLSDQLPSVKDAFDLWLRRKGVILEAQKRFQEALIHQDNSEAINTFQNLSAVRNQLSTLVFAGAGIEGIEAHQEKISALRARKGDLEARLSKLCKPFSLSQKTEKADCDKISAALPANSVLIEFSKAGLFDFNSKKTQEKWNPDHYLAFVLHANQGNNLRLLDLGNAEEIDRAVEEFRKEISEKEVKNNQEQIKACRLLYGKVFEPLQNELGDVKEIFISPDGNLSLIPFEVLQRPDGKYLIERYIFNYLAAARDLLLFGKIEEKGDKALLMGDPDFDLKEEEKNAEIRKLSIKKVGNAESIKRSSDMRRFHFKRLPSTAEEVRSIQKLFNQQSVIVYTGKRALEDVLKQMETPSILHLATHGFFLKDLEFEDTGNEPFDRGIKISTAGQKKSDKKIKIENPLLRSGFALAGANIALESDETGRSDGIVTAEKILGLNLRGTEMVVLSACGTGLGEVETGEGVFGLRRAFSRAGAKSLVMSLWDVPDMETKELMVEFYKAFLSGKVNRCNALRKAVLKEMAIVQERYGNKNPFYWGAFVFMGEP
jgi:CHAT domain-containing protein